MNELIKKLVVIALIFLGCVAPLIGISLNYGGFDQIPHYDLQSWIFWLSYVQLLCLGFIAVIVFSLTGKDDQPVYPETLRLSLEDSRKLSDIQLAILKLAEKVEKAAEIRAQVPEPVWIPEDYQHEDGAYILPPEEISIVHEEAPQDVPHEEAPQESTLPHPLEGIKIPKEWGEKTYE